MSRVQLRVLLVDDDENDYVLTRDLISEVGREGFDLDWVATYDVAREAVARQSHDLYLIDYRLGGYSGLELIREALASGCRKPMILLTGQGDHEVDDEAMRLGAADYLVKDQLAAPLLERSIRHAIERTRTLEALRGSEERFRLVVENSYDIITILNSEATICYTSPSLKRILGYDVGELVGKSILAYVHPEDGQTLNAAFRRILEAPGLIPPIEFRFLHRDGSTHSLESVGSSIPHEVDGMRILLNCRDITERKRAEEALRESEEKYRTIVSNINDAYYEVDADGSFTFFNESLTRIFGSSPNQLLGMNYRHYTDPATSQRLSTAYGDAMRTGESTTLIDYEIRRGDGEKRSLEVSLSPIRDGTARAKGFRGIIRDVTERKTAEKALRASEEQLRALSAHLQSVREEERTRIAREVHDELGQALTALKLDLSWVGDRLSRDQHALNGRVGSMLKFIDSTIETVRRISAELRPPILDHFGLTAAIEWELHRFNNRAGIECEFRAIPEDITLDQNRSTTVFRVLQEALTNVRRHANATAVKVDLRQDDDELILEVKDNGRGITESQTLAPTSLGLIGIRERARMCGGSVRILGSVEQGTTVTVVIPIEPSMEIRSM